MQIAEVMTRHVDTIARGTPLADVAKKMKRLDCGFIPVTDAEGERLIGVTTDRDLVVRGLAEGRDPDTTTVEEAMSDRVLYCFSNDEVEKAAESMADQQVYRLVVLDAPESKKLVGIVTLNDLRRHGMHDMAEKASDRIVGAA